MKFQYPENLIRKVARVTTCTKSTLCFTQSMTRIKNTKFKLCTCRSVQRVTRSHTSLLAGEAVAAKLKKLLSPAVVKSLPLKRKKCSETLPRATATRVAHAREKQQSAAFFSASALATSVASTAKTAKIGYTIDKTS